jgi:protein disulfide-isomerase A1
MNKYLCLALLLVAVCANDWVLDEGVYVLEEKNFDRAIAEFDFALVEFYAPWCGHCKRLTPEYAKAAQELASSNPEIKLCKVDATEQKELGSRFGIKGFPTIKFFVKGTSAPIDYEGGRTAPEIVQWLKKRTGPASVEVNSKEDAEKAIADNELVGIFFGNTGSKAYADYLVAAGSHEDVVFLHTSNEDVKTALGGADDTFILFKKFDEGKNQFNGPWSAESIRNFVQENKFPLIMPFDQKAAQRIFGEGQNSLFVLLSDNEASKKAEEAFRAAAPAIKDKITLSLARLSENMGQRLAEYIGVTEAHCPTLRIVLPNEDMKKFNFEGEVTAESVKNFVEDWSAGRLKPFYKSEPIPETNNEPVKVLVGKNFNDLVINNDNHVLVEFYAPWCGHCKQLEPIYNELAKKLAHVKDLTIAKVDATANEIEGTNIRGFPTLKFYKKGNKQSPIEYEGERNEEGFIEFFQQHGINVNAKPTGDGEL